MSFPTKEQQEEYDKDLTNIEFDYNEKLPLFVIGAGASVDFGYPTGQDLKEQIKEVLNPRSKNFSWLQSLYKETGLEESCETIRQTLDSFPTIDGCINFYKKDKSIEFVGKLAIAKVISDLEFNEMSLLKSESELNTTNSWIQSFFQFITKYLEKDQVKTRLGRIPMIIYNYDRNIEKYMNYLSNFLFGQNNENSGRLSHFYGVLPKESEFAKNGNLVKYSQNIKIYAEFINIFPNKNYDTRYIHEAESIIFLGFGYDEVNMKLLARHMDKKINRKIFGTSLGIDKNLKENVIGKLSNLYNAKKEDIHLYDVECKDFFSKFSSIEDFK
jgi:hypothetical protein